MTYLEFYEQCMIAGKMPKDGLCIALPKELQKKPFKMVSPTRQDDYELINNGLPFAYWGRGKWRYSSSSFSPLRQTLVLLMAAIAGEFDN